MTQIVVPILGESVSEATVARWLRKVGEAVRIDEPVVELETDKVTLEVNALVDGVITEIIVAEGDTVAVGTVLGEIEVGAQVSVVVPPKNLPKKEKAAPAVAQAEVKTEQELKASPVVQKLLVEASNVESVTGSAPIVSNEPREERIKMSKLRQVIAKRLKEAQNTAAMLTTFNEVDMGPVMDLRNEYKDIFEKKHAIKLGFMSFFVRAVVQALKEFPAINAQIDGEDIVYKNYYNIGVAVSTPQGLIVPVIRDADKMRTAEIEAKIADFGQRAREGKLAMDELTGGTYTITNGGVFGSLMSTPILNSPQSAILGMHAIQKRPVVIKDGSIEARPMMYLAQSYDHRLVDGREAVSSLVRIKQILEDPRRLVLDI
jgi:2-oxoglutarate dehydrogenase E2 component (dihydrolipoamide succinyltransferase)